MNEQELEQHLCDVLSDFAADCFSGIPPELSDDEKGIARVSTFDEAGVLTRNAGLVVRMRDGSEFQIAIVQSR